MPSVGYSENPPILDVITDIKNELRDFVQTRVRLAASEVSQAAGAVVSSLVTGAIAVLLAGIGLVWLVFGLTALVIAGFSDWRVGVPAAFGIIGVVLLAVGGLLLLSVRASLRSKPFLPKKTLEVLKSDTQMWDHDGTHLYE